MYIYQKKAWPNFTWDKEQVNQAIVAIKYEQGRLTGKMETLGFELQEQAMLETLTSDVVKSSEIEGHFLNSDEVRSSIARHLGIDIGGILPADRHIDGIVEVVLDATRHFNKPLTNERLCHWHTIMFPSSISGMMLVNPGVWRTDSEGPMQVVSGSYGREKLHFQAPAAKHLPQEINQFLTWFNQTQRGVDPFIKSAIAHLWFVTIHPFDDGNGRISRAIADMILAQGENQGNRFYSMTSQIRQDRKNYYNVLERTQKGSLDISNWLMWFLHCLHDAILQAESVLEKVLNKANFWKQHSAASLNPRQTTMLNFLFDGFKGNLTSIKWAKMMKCSQDSATRDINSLIQQGILIKSPAGGRSTCYLLKDFPINHIE